MASPNPILAVANKGTHLVTTTTQYLSTLPQQIDAVEDLISITAVTSSLLVSLSSSLTRFPSLIPSHTKSLIVPLCVDISRALSELDFKIQDAKTMKVFEKNECGLVRAPRFAWCDVCGGPREAGRLRGRLGVQKYRVRVLVDAVCWEGLRRMERSVEEEREWGALRGMVPLLAERLVGVWKDYMPRLKGESVREKVVVVQERPVEVVKEKEDVTERYPDLDLKKSSKLSIHSLSSTSTLTSTTTSSS